MKKLRNILFNFCLALTITLISASCAPKVVALEKIINDALEFSLAQSVQMASSLEDHPDLLPKTTDRFGNLETCHSDWWVSGFFPGVLWYLFEYSGNEEIKHLAHQYSMRVEDQQFTTNNHDVGFMIFCSFGNAYRLTGDTAYLDIIHNASNSLSTRFNPTISCIQSWDNAEWNKPWQYPVIIDNMMNLELLLWSAEKFNDPKYRSIATNHANTTRKNHYRPDFSCYHVVSYDTITGLPEYKHTAQGFNHESSWARGQAWGLYGFVMMYRFTKDDHYLNQANNIAEFIINHSNLPDDKIPYWDFDAPNIPDTYRDASAGAIIASALIELSLYVEKDKAENFLSIAETQVRSLSANYQNSPGNNGNFILKHGVGHMPNNTEVDVPLSYADYYYVEALMRMKKLKGF